MRSLVADKVMSSAKVSGSVRVRLATKTKDHLDISYFLPSPFSFT